MDEAELAGVRTQLEGFAAAVFEGFARVDQRANGLRYLRGLMLNGQRKSMQPMAERLGVDHQQLQQFLTSSTWDFVAVRRRLAARTLDVVQPDAWIVDDTGFVKDGHASPGVARQYSGTLGKVGNCQIAVSLHAATDEVSGVLDWRLFIPESWDETCIPDPQDPEAKPVNAHARRIKHLPTTKGQAGQTKKRRVKDVAPQELIASILERRRRSRIPEDERYRPKWELALEMIDEVMAWGHVPPTVVSDAGYGQNGEFRNGLTQRGIHYVLAITATTSALPGTAQMSVAQYAGQGRPPSQPAYPDPPSSVKELALQAGRDSTELVRWRHSIRPPAGPDQPVGELAGHFMALRIRPAGRAITREEDGTLPERWLLAEWPPGKDEPTDYWLSDLPADTPIAELVRVAKMRWRIEHDYRETKTGLGLDHFEGRSWTGWNRHVTLVTAAQLFITELRRHHPKVPGQA